MKPLEDGLEVMIELGRLPDENTPVGAYLNSNTAAREEVAAMMDLSRQMRESFTLSTEELEDLEPAPGFYARVLSRIESQAAPPSIWNFFLEPLGMRLVYASLALATLLFTATFFDASPVNEPQVDQAQTIPSTDSPVISGAFLASDSGGIPVVESKNPNEDRGAALMQLTTYDQ